MDNKNLIHFRTRALGEIYRRKRGEPETVQRLIYSEVQFDDSEDSDRFLDSVRVKVANKHQQSNLKSMKFISRDDEF